MNIAPWKIEYSTTGSGQVIGVTDVNGRDVRLSGVGSTNAPEASLTTVAMVRAVNCHAEMVEALQDLIRVMPIDMDPLQKQALRKAEAALARATQTSTGE